MNKRIFGGKFLNALAAGTARRNQFVRIGKNDHFDDFPAAATDHGGNGAAFGAGTYRIRDVFNVAAAVNPSVVGINCRADGKAGIGAIGVGRRSLGGFKKFFPNIHDLPSAVKSFINDYMLIIMQFGKIAKTICVVCNNS